MRNGREADVTEARRQEPEAEVLAQLQILGDRVGLWERAK
jgi:hypothetical protein